MVIDRNFSLTDVTASNLNSSLDKTAKQSLLGVVQRWVDDGEKVNMGRKSHPAHHTPVST